MEIKMLKTALSNKTLQLTIGLLTGIAFGFLLHKGRVIRYDVIIGQLLLKDFTVVKVMMTAVAVGMVGVYGLRSAGLVQLHVRSGSVGATVVGGLIFGVGFAVLGYCPGTMLAATGSGSMDALAGGVVGAIFGTWLFALVYPKLEMTILNKGAFRYQTIPEMLNINPWLVIVPVCCAIAILLFVIEKAGL